jgi:hypothetical protein
MNSRGCNGLFRNAFAAVTAAAIALNRDRRYDGASLGDGPLSVDATPARQTAGFFRLCSPTYSANEKPAPKEIVLLRAQ